MMLPLLLFLSVLVFMIALVLDAEVEDNRYKLDFYKKYMEHVEENYRNYLDKHGIEDSFTENIQSQYELASKDVEKYIKKLKELSYIKHNADRIYICNHRPYMYEEAKENSIAHRSISENNLFLSKKNKEHVLIIKHGKMVVDKDGTGTYFALVDTINKKLLQVSPCTMVNIQSDLINELSMNDWVIYNELDDDEQLANKKSKDLLISKLNNNQKETFMKHNYIDISSKISNDIFYRIKANTLISNVELFIYDKKISNMCCIMEENGKNMPIYDHLIAQKLWIENNEKEFINKANVGY